MKNFYFTPAALAMVALLAACGSTPKSTSLLDQAHSDYRIAQNNPNVGKYAPLELKQAGDTMAQADALAAERASGEKIDQYAYLARQKIALTEEVAKQKAAEAEVRNASKERDQVRLDQRTNEANAANIRAEQAAQVALLAINDAALAQADTARARQQTQEAQVDTASAMVDAANSERMAQEAQQRAAQFEAQLGELAAKKTERGMVITLNDVLFGTDLARLTSDGEASAQKLAKILERHPERTVLIEGFTDSTGTTEHNQQLSERRAMAVQNALQTLGIGRDRVVVRGYGESYPVAANDSAENRQMNRRVEIILSDEAGRIMAR